MLVKLLRPDHGSIEEYLGETCSEMCSALVLHNSPMALTIAKLVGDSSSFAVGAYHLHSRELPGRNAPSKLQGDNVVNRNSTASPGRLSYHLDIIYCSNRQV